MNQDELNQLHHKLNAITYKINNIDTKINRLEEKFNQSRIKKVRRPMSKIAKNLIISFIFLVMAAGGGYYLYTEQQETLRHEKLINTGNKWTTPQGEGRIKGNINSKGEKIYHLPGGRYYTSVYAEKLFITEAEAQDAGYRKSEY